jgi:hypothetical protein
LVTAVAILSTSSGLREVLNLGVRLWVGNGMPGWSWLQGAEGLVYTQRCFRGPGVVAEVMEIARRWWLWGRVRCKFGGGFSSVREDCDTEDVKKMKGVSWKARTRSKFPST